ncbi:hypothetical protein D3C84_704160 [compost metagenome]
MKLHHFKLSKGQLTVIPEVERNLFVLLAHAANELNTLIKLFKYCSEHPATTEVEKEARNAQAMTIGRLLTGKLYECWKLLQSAFFGTKLSQVYEPLLDAGATTYLNALKKYFGRKNLIEAVRNQHAFHYSPDQISRGFANLADEEALNVYMATTNANTLYAFADVIAGYSLLEDICPGNPVQAFDALISETTEVLDWFNQVIGAFMMIVIEKYIGCDLEALDSREVEIGGALDWKVITIPYFIEVADSEVTK